MARRRPVAPQAVLSDRALNRAALARQLLLSRQAITPAAAVAQLAGMQAQVPRPPFVGLWSRLQPFDRASLTTAIDARQVVRATMMRATIHLVTRADFLAWRSALQPMLHRVLQSLFAREMTQIDLAGLIDAARQRFEAGACTFAELRTHLKTRFPALNERVMGYAVRMQLPLVQTPMPGAEWAYPASASFTLADGWLNASPAADGGLAPLVQRYLAAFGPASVRDFQGWSGLQGAAATFEALRPSLAVFTDAAGRELFDLPESPRPDDEVPAPLRLLPEYDNLLLAYDDRTRIIAAEHRPHVITRNLIVPATFLVDGVVAGTWKVERKGARARFTATPFGRLDRRTRTTLTAEAEALLPFVAPDASAHESAIL